MGSLAGAWLAVVHGLGGMRHHGDSLSFAPRLPPRIQRLTFKLTFLDRLLKVSVNRNRVTYSMSHGKPLSFAHYGQELRLTAGRSVVRPVPRLRPREEAKQPAGRAPARRGVAEPKVLRPKRARRVSR
jgi:alpha,alpha-trehalose phosphorylase